MKKKKDGRRFKNSQGYIIVYSPNHPFKDKSNNVKGHRLVMEAHLKRYLKPEELVHHINEIRDDNRIENLKLMSRGEHICHHHTGSKSPHWIDGRKKDKEFQKKYIKAYRLNNKSKIKKVRRRKYLRHKSKTFCKDCKKNISPQAKRCYPCFRKEIKRKRKRGRGV